MNANGGVIIALIIVVVLVLVFRGWHKPETFVAATPHTMLNAQMDMERGAIRPDVRAPTHTPMQVAIHGIASGRTVEDVAQAEQLARLGVGALQSAQAGISGTAATDYGEYVTSLVVDPRTRLNHAKWVAEAEPWSGVAMKVDTLDLEPTIDFRGLRRPQAVAVYNPSQLTEIGTDDLIGNKRFDFQAV